MTRKVKGENGYAPVGNELKELQAQVAANSKAIDTQMKKTLMLLQHTRK